jgi:hypothetical protein
LTRVFVSALARAGSDVLLMMTLDLLATDLRRALARGRAQHDLKTLQRRVACARAGWNASGTSKILAERAAWDFVKQQPVSTQLTTILPGAVFGPILTPGNLGSVQIIEGLLRGHPSALPRLGFWITDVRDLADLHIRAMTTPAAAGQRFIAAGTSN